MKEVLLNKLNHNLKKLLKEELVHIILFGSQMKGEIDEFSDFDILIVLQTKANWRLKRKIREVCYLVSLELEIIIDSKIISKEELNNASLIIHPLYQDALNNGIYATG